MAGTGKSTIARTAAHNFADQKQLGASFYFSRGRGDLGHAEKFFTTIAWQLAARAPSLRHHISKAISENPQITQEGLGEQWKHLIFQPLSRLDNASLPPQIFILAIDALDECDGEDDVRLILRLIAEAKTLKRAKLRVFITSRPETPIRLYFRKMPEDVYQSFALHEVDPAVTQHDKPPHQTVV